MEQLNTKTKEEKTMQVFTTNWYLYKTHLHPIFIKSQKRNSETNSYGIKTDYSPRIKAENRTMDFEELLMEAIDEGLSLLGESSKQAVYCYLGKTFKMNRLDIPYRIEEFIDAIERIFGTGAKILEIQIMKCLFTKVGYTLKHYSKQKNLTFTEYITAIKQQYTERKKVNYYARV